MNIGVLAARATALGENGGWHIGMCGAGAVHPLAIAVVAREEATLEMKTPELHWATARHALPWPPETHSCFCSSGTSVVSSMIKLNAPRSASASLTTFLTIFSMF